MTPNEIRKMIKRHEGYRDKVYKDSLGNLTCGYGHYLAEGSEISKSIADELFTTDMINAFADYYRLGLELDSVREAVLIDMIFNMGLAGVRKFKKMLMAIAEKDYFSAADEMEKSLWAEQVGIRATELAHMMRTGLTETSKKEEPENEEAKTIGRFSKFSSVVGDDKLRPVHTPAPVGKDNIHAPGIGRHDLRKKRRARDPRV